MSYLTVRLNEDLPDQFDVLYAGCAVNEALVKLEIAMRSHAIERDRLLPVGREERDAASLVWETTFGRLQQELADVRRRAEIATRIANVGMRRAVNGEIP
jgi:hypothetical protein